MSRAHERWIWTCVMSNRHNPRRRGQRRRFEKGRRPVKPQTYAAARLLAVHAEQRERDREQAEARRQAAERKRYAPTWEKHEWLRMTGYSWRWTNPGQHPVPSPPPATALRRVRKLNRRMRVELLGQRGMMLPCSDCGSYTHASPHGQGCGHEPLPPPRRKRRRRSWLKGYILVPGLVLTEVGQQFLRDHSDTLHVYLQLAFQSWFASRDGNWDVHELVDDYVDLNDIELPIRDRKAISQLAQRGRWWT